jgi:acyl transferase domain-containing protein
VRTALARRSHTLFIEISAHPVLVHAIDDLVESAAGTAVAVSSMCRDQSEQHALMTGLAAAYMSGCRPDWRKVYPDGRFVPVPGYPWQRKSFWVDTPTGSATAEPAPPVAPKATVDTGDDLVRTIVRHTADVLARPQDEIDPSVPLLDAGLDSLLAAKLGTRINQALGVRVPVRQLMARLSVTDLAAQLGDQLPMVSREPAV